MRYTNKLIKAGYLMLKRFAPIVYTKKAIEQHYNHMCMQVRNREIDFSSLWENVLAKLLGLTVTSEDHSDFSDGSDAKLCLLQSRKDSNQLSFQVQNIRTKTGILRVLGVNDITEWFHYFEIPYEAYKDLKNSIWISINNKTMLPSGKYAEYEKELKSITREVS